LKCTATRLSPASKFSSDVETIAFVCSGSEKDLGQKDKILRSYLFAPDFFARMLDGRIERRPSRRFRHELSIPKCIHASMASSGEVATEASVLHFCVCAASAE
jgi:hypothetical protein